MDVGEKYTMTNKYLLSQEGTDYIVWYDRKLGLRNPLKSNSLLLFVDL